MPLALKTALSIRSACAVPILCLIAIMVVPENGLCYIDPGSAGPIFTSLGALLLGLLTVFGFAIRYLRSSIVKIISRRFFRPALVLVIVVGATIWWSQTRQVTRNPMEAKVKPGYRKVLLVGFDGMDPQILDLLRRKGSLPAFDRLIAGGAQLHQLASTRPPQSPVVWTTLASGLNPGSHGIFDFIEREPGGYLPRLTILKDKRSLFKGTKYLPVTSAEKFWNLVAKSGIPATVVRWPLTFPAQDCDCRILSGMGVPDIHGILGKYSYFTENSFDDKTEDKENLIRVTVEDKRIVTSIRGPKVSTGFSSDYTNVPLSVAIDKGSNSATLSFAGRQLRLVPGRWSDWIKLPMKIDPLSTIATTFRFHLTSLSPFGLYLSPIQYDPANPKVRISTPPGYAADLSKAIGTFHTLGMPEDTKAYENGRLDRKAFLESVSFIHEERLKMLKHSIVGFKKGLLAVVFDLPDRIQHLFWNENEIDDNDRIISVGSTIESWYTKLDSILAGLKDDIDDETALIVLSDHGFSSFRFAVDLNRWLYEQGYLVLKTPPKNDKDFGELFALVDWSGTRAFSLGFTSLYLNQLNRFSEGIVTENDRAALLDEISRKLLSFADQAAGGIHPIHAVYRGSTIYKGKYRDDGPDLVIGFRPGYRMSWQSAIGGIAPKTISENTKRWSGDHLIDASFVPGILLTNFTTTSVAPSVYDIAPTVLDLLGLKTPAEMEGRNLR